MGISSNALHPHQARHPVPCTPPPPPPHPKQGVQCPPPHPQARCPVAPSQARGPVPSTAPPKQGVQCPPPHNQVRCPVPSTPPPSKWSSALHPTHKQVPSTPSKGSSALHPTTTCGGCVLFYVPRFGSVWFLTVPFRRMAFALKIA